MLGNWINQTTTTTGTGDLTLSAVTGYPGFNDTFGLDREFYYTILDATGLPIETGVGHLSSSTTLVRDRPVVTYSSGVLDDSGPAAISLTSGTKTVICADEAGSRMVAPHVIAPSSTTAYRRVIPHAAMGYTATSVTLTRNRLYFVPIMVSGVEQIATIRAMNGISGGSGGTQNWKLALYDSLPTGGPGKKLYESGSLAPTSLAELTYTLPASVRLPPGWYWLAIAHDCTTAPNIYSSAPAGSVTPLGMDMANGPVRCFGLSYDMTAGWTSLPNPAPNPMVRMNVNQAATVPSIYLGVV